MDSLRGFDSIPVGNEKNEIGMTHRLRSEPCAGINNGDSGKEMRLRR